MTAPTLRSPTLRTRVLIIDDEALARQRLMRLLSAEPDMEVVGECGDGREAVSVVDRLRPDLIFLDVQMPGLDGFGVLEGVAFDPPPLTIFVTAHHAHAVRAFDVDALDYLLKPFDEERFQRALERVRAQVAQRNSDDFAARAPITEADSGGQSTTREAPPRFLDRIMIKTGSKSIFVRTEQIDQIEADGNYVRIHIETKTYLLRETMARLERSLNPARFVRIHRSSIVNLERVREVEPYFGHDFLVRLSTGARVRMSRWYRDEFERRMRHGAG